MDKQAKIDFEKNEQEEKTQNPKEIEVIRRTDGFGPGVPPTEEHVRIYFDEKGFPPVEAEKFYNYFQSNGWLVGGRSKMKDWKAATRNWILNAQKFSNHGKQQRNSIQKPKPGNLSATVGKDYSEPL